MCQIFSDKILNKLNSCVGLSLKYCEIILGFLEEEMDLQNYILILGKTYLWTCRCKETGNHLLATLREFY